MREKYKITVLMTVKIIITYVIIYAMYNNIPNLDEYMNGKDMTSIGLNAFYALDEKSKPIILTTKIMLLTGFILMMYIITLSKVSNIYEGLKEVIRIKSSSLLDYLMKLTRFLFKYVFIDVVVMLAAVYASMAIVGVENIWSLDVMFNMLSMLVFYTLMPFMIVFIVDRLDFFIALMLTLSLFAYVLVYKMSLGFTVIGYVITTIIVGTIILIKERLS